MADGIVDPWERIVGSDNDLAGADLSNQMAQRLRGENKRVEVPVCLRYSVGCFFGTPGVMAWEKGRSLNRIGSCTRAGIHLHVPRKS